MFSDGVFCGHVRQAVAPAVMWQGRWRLKSFVVPASVDGKVSGSLGRPFTNVTSHLQLGLPFKSRLDLQYTPRLLARVCVTIAN